MRDFVSLTVVLSVLPSESKKADAAPNQHTDNANGWAQQIALRSQGHGAGLNTFNGLCWQHSLILDWLAVLASSSLSA